MNRATPIPAISISSTEESDGDNRRVINVVIDVYVGEYSSGFVVLDEPDDLFILRDAISEYIKSHNINPQKHQSMTKTKTESNEEAGWLRVLSDYLMCFEPATTPGPGVEIKSTDEIINDLATMAEMEPNPVADVLASLGFRSHHPADGRHGWLLKRIAI